MTLNDCILAIIIALIGVIAGEYVKVKLGTVTPNPGTIAGAW